MRLPRVEHDCIPEWTETSTSDPSTAIEIASRAEIPSDRIVATNHEPDPPPNTRENRAMNTIHELTNVVRSAMRTYRVIASSKVGGAVARVDADGRVVEHVTGSIERDAAQAKADQWNAEAVIATLEDHLSAHAVKNAPESAMDTKLTRRTPSLDQLRAATVAPLRHDGPREPQIWTTMHDATPREATRALRAVLDHSNSLIMTLRDPDTPTPSPDKLEAALDRLRKTDEGNALMTVDITTASASADCAAPSE